MKSIMEEASSITKAIESAWNRAGKPQEFTIKVLEHPETNFFGLKTVKSAKIAIFFNELTVRQPVRPESPARPSRPAPSAKTPTLRPLPSSSEQDRSKGSYQRPERRAPQAESQQRPEYQKRTAPAPRPEQRDQRDQRDTRETREVREREPREPREHRSYDQRPSYEPRNNDRQESRDVWTPELVSAAQEWLKETVALMGYSDIQIIPAISQNYLKLQLDKPIADDARQEELQLKSWGNLLIESLREKFNKPFRSLRIIIESRRN